MRDPRFTTSFLNVGSYGVNGNLCSMWQNVAKCNYFFKNTRLKVRCEKRWCFHQKPPFFYIKPHYFTFTKQSIRKGSRYENSILHEFFLKMTFSLVWIYVANSRGPIEKGGNGLFVILIELPWMRDPRFTPSYLNAGSYVGNGTLCFMWQNVAKCKPSFWRGMWFIRTL